jgi:hypothetical protein
VLGQNVIQLSYPLLDLCNQLVALQILDGFLHATARLMRVFVIPLLMLTSGGTKGEKMRV